MSSTALAFPADDAAPHEVADYSQQLQQPHGSPARRVLSAAAVVEHDESSVLVCPECSQRCGTLLTFMRHWGRLHVASFGADNGAAGPTAQTQNGGQPSSQLAYEDYFDLYNAVNGGGHDDDDDGNDDSAAVPSESATAIADDALPTGRSPLTQRSQQMTARSPTSPVVLGWHPDGGGGSGGGGGNGTIAGQRSQQRLAGTKTGDRTGGSAANNSNGNNANHKNGSVRRSPGPPSLPVPDDTLLHTDDDDDVPPPPPTDDEYAVVPPRRAQTSRATANVPALPTPAANHQHQHQHQHQHGYDDGDHGVAVAAAATTTAAVDGHDEHQHHHSHFDGDASQPKSFWDPEQEAFYMVDPVTGESWWA